MNAINAENQDSYDKVMEEIDKWNEKWMGADKPEFLIDIGPSIRTRQKPAPVSKPFRGLGMDYTESYR